MPIKTYFLLMEIFLMFFVTVFQAELTYICSQVSLETRKLSISSYFKIYNKM